MKTNTDDALFSVVGPNLPGYELHKAGRYKSEPEAEQRALSLARLYPGHEFHTLKVLTTYRVPVPPATYEVIRHN